MHLLLSLALGLVMQLPLARGAQVVGVGYPGFSTRELSAKFDDALQSTHPSYVVIMAGGNDALNDAKFLPAEESGKNLRSMVQRARAAGASVVLVLLHDPDIDRLMTRHRPEAYGDMPPMARHIAVNQQIAAVAAEEHATLVDFRGVLAKAGGASAELSTDGVHLTAKGYGLLAAAVRSSLPSSLGPKDTVLCFGDSLTYGQGVRPLSAPETPDTYPSQLRALLRK